MLGVIAVIIRRIPFWRANLESSDDALYWIATSRVEYQNPGKGSAKYAAAIETISNRIKKAGARSLHTAPRPVFDDSLSQSDCHFALRKQDIVSTIRRQAADVLLIVETTPET